MASAQPFIRHDILHCRCDCWLFPHPSQALLKIVLQVANLCRASRHSVLAHIHERVGVNSLRIVFELQMKRGTQQWQQRCNP
eukprot:scaffold209073_cov21-Prasinocladus_malaysianus.AAC.4